MDDSQQPLKLEQAVLQQGLQCFCIVERGAVVFASAGFTASFGGPAGRPGASWSEVVATADRARVQSALLEAHHTGNEVRVVFAARRNDGSHAQVKATIARIDAYREQPLLLAIDETTGHERMLSELKLLAFKDPLTGLANRACLLDECRSMLQRCRKQGGMVGLLLADLDDFKRVNDTGGHGAGDAALVRVARCMEEVVREGDIAARVGGDEFAVALPRLSGAEDAALVAGRLIRAIAGSAGAQPGSAVGVSVGIALWPAHGDSIDDLFSRADDAMYRAKRAGKNRYCLADEAGVTRASRPIRFFDWGSDRDLGIGDMDRDHREMAGLVNQLGDELKAGRDEERLVACMDRLVAHTATHFAREERWMDRHAYAHVAPHKAEHTRLLEDLASFAVRLDSRSMVLTMRYMQDWLCRHVDESDRQLAQAILAHDAGAPGLARDTRVD